MILKVQKDFENSIKAEKNLRKENEELVQQLEKALKAEKALREELSRYYHINYSKFSP